MKTLKGPAYWFLVLTAAMIVFPIAVYYAMNWVDGPNGPEPLNKERCYSDTDYFNTNELECEEWFWLIVGPIILPIFLFWISYGIQLRNGYKTRDWKTTQP